MDYVLYHHGIKGMKWGVRRTPAQLGHKTSSKNRKSERAKAREEAKKKKAVAKAKAAEQNKKKSLRDMSDEEVVKAIERARLEQTYRQYHPEQVSAGKKFVSKIFGDVIVPAAVGAGKRQLENLLNSYGDKFIKDQFKEAADPDSIEALTKSRDKLKLKKEIQDLKTGKKEESLDDLVKRLRNEEAVYSINKNREKRAKEEQQTDNTDNDRTDSETTSTPAPVKKSPINRDSRETGKKYVLSTISSSETASILDTAADRAKAKSAGIKVLDAYYEIHPEVLNEKRNWKTK